MDEWPHAEQEGRGGGEEEKGTSAFAESLRICGYSEARRGGEERRKEARRKNRERERERERERREGRASSSRGSEP